MKNINDIQIIDYKYAKELVKIEGENPLRELTEEEKERLIKSLLQDGCVSGSLTIVGTLLGGYVIKNGRHRWSVLPEVYKRNPNFSTKIPFLVKDKFEDDKEERKYAIINQLGQRNLTNEEIVEYVNLLMNEDGLSRKKAYQQVAEQIGCSENKVRRIVQPEYAQRERERQEQKRAKLAQKTPETIETSLEKSSEKVLTIFEWNNSEEEIEFKVEKTPINEEGIYYETLPNGGKYKIYPDGTEEYMSVVSIPKHNEYEDLLKLKDAVENLGSNLSYSPFYSSVKNFIEDCDHRIKYVEKVMG